MGARTERHSMKTHKKDMTVNPEDSIENILMLRRTETIRIMKVSFIKVKKRFQKIF